MAVSKAINLVCDVCFTPQDESHWRVSEARDAARQDGWMRSHTRDICPGCVDLSRDESRQP